MLEVFPAPPLVAYRRQRNIRESLIRAKVAPENNRKKRFMRGMRKCGKCLACSYIKEGNVVKGKHFLWKICKQVNCESSNVVYIIECEKDYCKERYIGITNREFRERIYEHIGYVRNWRLDKTTGAHFNSPGQSTSNMKFTILEKVKSTDPLYGREREKLLIRKFNTF